MRKVDYFEYIFVPGGELIYETDGDAPRYA